MYQPYIIRAFPPYNFAFVFLNIQCTMLVLVYLLFILEYTILPIEDIEANLTNIIVYYTII